MKTPLRALNLLLVGLLLLMNISVPAQAADPAKVRIHIANISATDIKVDDVGVISVSGTVTNTSKSPISWVTAQFWQGPKIITTPDQLAKALTEEDPGKWLSNEKAGNLVYLAKKNKIKPGDSIPFEVKARIADLGFINEGVYQTGVQVRALTNAGEVEIIGVNRWLTTVTAGNHGHNSVVLLASPPTMTAPGVFRNNGLSQLLIDRLANLLELAKRPGSEYLLDPNLYDEVTALAKEHTVAGEKQPPSQAAIEYKTELDKLISTQPGYRLPYGNPDFGQAKAGKVLKKLLSYEILTVPASHPTAKLPLAIYAGHNLDGETAGEIARKIGASRIFSKNLLVSGPKQIPITPIPAEQQPSWKTDQLILAQELVASLIDKPAVRLIYSTQDIHAARLQPKWRTLQPTPVAKTKPKWRKAAKPAVDLKLYNQLSKQLEQLNYYQKLVDNQTVLTDQVRMLFRACSSQNVDNDGQKILQEIPALPAKPLTIRLSQQIIMTSEESIFPMGVTNNSPIPLTVRSVFESSAPQRISAANTELLTIDGGETAEINVKLVATSSAVVTMRVYLVTKTGIPIDKPTIVEITANQASKFGWVIIIVSAVLLIGGTAWRIRAVQRSARGANK